MNIDSQETRVLQRMCDTFFSFVDELGRKPVSSVIYTWHMLRMVYVSIRAAIFDPSQGLRTIFSVISSQIYFTGWQAMPLITVLALATGGISILQSASQLQLLGGAGMIGNVLVVIIVREVGPLLTALIVIARSGTAVATEIGNMRAGRETEALEMMGINPLSFIVFPRIVGGVASVLCLAFYFDVIALLGGFFVAHLINHMPFSFYADSLSTAIGGDDVILFLLKNSFSGMIIFVVSCYQGFSVKQSSHEVPQATTKAVVNSIIYVTSFNLTVTTIYYVGQLSKMGLI